ncbi:MAG: hypothetical protein PHR53_02470 [Bacteroidales bacterium]|nr:hypothetical protein [Bacteroidales bacterium]
MYRILIRLHPAVVRWLENNFTKENDAFDLTKSDKYYLISGALQRFKVTMPSKVSKRYQRLTPVYIRLTEFDFYHYGWEMAPLHQVRLSDHLYREILNNGCQKIMLAYVVAGIPRDAAIREFLSENFFSPDELNFSGIRKYYQRKFADKESDTYQFIKNLLVYRKNNYQKINVQSVPNSSKV